MLPFMLWGKFLKSAMGTAVVLAMLAIYYAFLPAPVRFADADPDHFYHLAISRITATEGMIRSLPQVENLRWGDYFPEKEFLFHMISGLAYKMGGDKGVELLVPIFGVAIALSLWSLTQVFVGPICASMIVIAGIFGNPFFVARLCYLRPHLLAILIFVWIVWAVVREKPRWLGAFCFAYALSYHAFYIPMILVAASILPLPGILRVSRSALKIPAYGFFGLLCGSLINPYFPANIKMGLLHLGVALQKYPVELMNIGGMELRTPPSDIFMSSHAFIWILAGIATYLLILRSTALKLWQSWVVMLVFLMMTGFSPRGNEYLIPLAFLLTAVVIGSAGVTKKVQGWTAAALLTVQLAVSASPSFTFFRDVTSNVSPGAHPAIFLALEKIPKTAPGETGKKIFTCDWSMGSHILYKRPDLRFLDLLDPRFLYETSREESELWLSITSATLPKSVNVVNKIESAFNAHYILCNNSPLNEQLRNDPRTKELYRTFIPVNIPLAKRTIQWEEDLRHHQKMSQLNTSPLAPSRPTLDHQWLVLSEQIKHAHINSEIDTGLTPFKVEISLFEIKPATES